MPTIPSELQWIVSNPLKALQHLAACYRASCKAHQQLIALTGSNGKTTTRTLLTTILQAWRPTTATQANLNNTIGVPLQILRAQANHQFNVLECGTNQFGELSMISQMAQPDMIIITNTSDVHTAFFKTHDGVIRAKSELFTHLDPKGLMILPFDDQGLAHWQAHYSHFRHITFGTDPQADAYASTMTLDTNGCTHFTYHKQQQSFAIKSRWIGLKDINVRSPILKSKSLVKLSKI